MFSLLFAKSGKLAAASTQMYLGFSELGVLSLSHSHSGVDGESFPQEVIRPEKRSVEIENTRVKIRLLFMSRFYLFDTADILKGEDTGYSQRFIIYFSIQSNSHATKLLQLASV
jgi:hypothetical protein